MTDQDAADPLIDDACFPHFHRLRRLIHQLARKEQRVLYEKFIAQTELKRRLDQGFGDYWFRIGSDGSVTVYLYPSLRWLTSLSPEGTPAVSNEDAKEQVIGHLIPVLEAELVLDEMADI